MLIRWQGPGQGVTDNGTNVYFHNDLEFTSGAFTGITGGDINTVNALYNVKHAFSLSEATPTIEHIDYSPCCSLILFLKTFSLGNLSK